MSKTEKAISWMEATAKNNKHGYDQIFRWGQKGDYDCSGAVITAWTKAGVKVKKKVTKKIAGKKQVIPGASYTGDMKRAFLAHGFVDVTKSVNLATGEGLVRGDVLLKEGHHTAMYCGDGKEVEASINEKGAAEGGKPGDQTGREFLIRSYRNYPWDHALRYTAESPEKKADPKTATKKKTATNGKKDLDTVAEEVIAGKWGSGDARRIKLTSAGYNYTKVQARVNALLKK